MNYGYVDISVLPLYLAAVVLIDIAPGPDMAYMVGAGIAGGRSAATRAALGVSLGVALFTVAVAAGLGAVVARHPGVLTGLEIFGALYLAWLAYGTFRDARSAASAQTAEDGHDNWFRRGLVVNLTNPKVMLFFVAFLPQFLGHATSLTLQLLMLGLLFQLTGLIIDLAIGWSAGSFRDKVLARPSALKAMTYTSAAVFTALATIIAIEVIRALTLNRAA
jgi:threonine/homoserine/homoserine lactone efflux protein